MYLYYYKTDIFYYFIYIYGGGIIRGCYCIWVELHRMGTVLERHCFKSGIISGWQLIRVAIYSDGTVSGCYCIGLVTYEYFDDSVSGWYRIGKTLDQTGTESSCYC